MNLGQETEELEFKKSTGEIKEGMISLALMLNKTGVSELDTAPEWKGGIV